MPNRNLLIALTAILGTGLLFLVCNLELPIVRNSFVYAKTATNVIEHGGNPLPVISDTTLSHGKPIAFSLLAVPFVSFLGPDAGVKVASFLGTAFFLCIAYFFFVRLNRRAGIDARFIPLELALLFFNPLVFYQFWSAYADSLFSGEVLLAFVLIDVIMVEHERDTRSLIFLLGFVIYAAILTKFYGMILGIACPIYALLHLRSFLKHSINVRSKIALLVLVFFLLGVSLVLARLGRNPTLDFAVAAPRGLGGGYSGYMVGLTDPSGHVLISSIIMLIFALVLNFHCSLPFLLWGGSRRKWPLAPTCFAGIYVLGLLPFLGTSYNMRFFLPVFPFFVVAIVGGMLSTKRRLTQGILVAFLGAASFLTLNYNLASFHEHFPKFNEIMAVRALDDPRPHLLIDNLRLDRHLATSKWIERINGTIEPDGVLYWASMYYGAATHGVAEELGIRNDIRVKYVYRASKIPTTKRTVYLTRYRYRGSSAEVEDRFAVKSLGSGLFRLAPLRVELSAPKDHFDQGKPVSFEARASASADAEVLRVEFLVDGLPIAIDTDYPFEFNFRDAALGRHVVTARVHDTKGNTALSPTVTVFVGKLALERSIARSDDDAEELAGGSMDLTSSDLELITDSRAGDQIVGLRFTAVRLPKGVEIKEAYLQFTADEVSQEQTELTIHAELAGDSAAFTDARDDISSRKRTSSLLKWSPDPWDTVGERSVRQRTPILSALIQEVIAQPHWQAGNALVFIISGSGRRVAESYDGDRTGVTLLYVEYEAQ